MGMLKPHKNCIVNRQIVVGESDFYKSEYYSYRSKKVLVRVT